MMVYWLKDSCKVCHQSLVSFDLSIVSQIGRFLAHLLLVKLSWSVRSPFVGFVSIMDKLVVCKMPVVDIC